MRVEVERLIKQAERDLVNARKNVGIEAYEWAAFVGQQAVEKFLKAVWMLRKKEAPIAPRPRPKSGRRRRRLGGSGS